MASANPGKLALWLVVLVLAAAGVFWFMHRPRPNPILTYPASRTAVATDFFNLIGSGQPGGYQKAFSLITWPQRRAHRNHAGQYRQRFENLNAYLTGLFGSHWADDIHVEPTADLTSAGDARWPLTVRIKTERFHLKIQNQNRFSSVAGLARRHYGLVAIREFSFSGGAKAQQVAGTSALLNMVGATGAAANVTGISAAYGSSGTQKPWQIKQRLLPVVENPQAGVLAQCVYQLWPVRKDPTVRMVLEKIQHDSRYALNIQRDAQAVLSGRVDKAILIGNGVVNTK